LIHVFNLSIEDGSGMSCLSDALRARQGWLKSLRPAAGLLLHYGRQAGSLSYYLSNSIAIPMPPLMHKVASPRLAFRRFISCNSVVVMRTPVHPIGCPSAMAPPFTFSLY